MSNTEMSTPTMYKFFLQLAIILLKQFKQHESLHYI